MIDLNEIASPPGSLAETYTLNGKTYKALPIINGCIGCIASHNMSLCGDLPQCTTIMGCEDELRFILIS